MELNTMRRELDRLPDLLRLYASQPPEAPLGAANRPRRVYIAGSGDSYHAALAARMAFKHLSGVSAEALSAFYLLEYGLPVPDDGLVIGVSASGKSARVVELLQKVRDGGGQTLALTGTEGSPISQAAAQCMVVPIPDVEPAPGVRTHAASLMGLLLIAAALSGEAERLGQVQAELARLADVLAAAVAAGDAPARAAAEAIREAPVLMCLGSGPSFGTAMFSAAKVVEAAGQYAAPQDLEEWAHVEIMARPADMPLLLIAPEGARSRWRARDVAHTAQVRGKRVIGVISAADTELAHHTDFVLPVPGQVAEMWTPLVYQAGGTLLAYHLADLLGRRPFETMSGTAYNTPAGGSIQVG